MDGRSAAASVPCKERLTAPRPAKYSSSAAKRLTSSQDVDGHTHLCSAVLGASFHGDLPVSVHINGAEGLLLQAVTIDVFCPWHDSTSQTSQSL